MTLTGGITCDAVGMQTLIDDIRSDGAGNVIIVPGLAGEGTLAGMPTLSDPVSPSSPQLAYGVHYPSLSGGSTVWDQKFGNAGASVPVLVTEWYANSFHLCTRNEPQRAAWLLAYRVVIPLRKPFTDEAVAVYLENQLGGAQNRIINTVQLGRQAGSMFIDKAGTLNEHAA